MVGQQEFDLPKVVLDIVYSQALCWYVRTFSTFMPDVLKLHILNSLID
jgi:hypothetical protein